MALETGVRLGPYEILGLIGAGGMGEVYKARDTRLGRTVALKVLPPRLAALPTLVARFEREARAIAALDHPHICTLHDVGEHEGQAYLVMEHLEGETLADRLKKGALPLPVALEVGAQVADALAAAHRGGILHRDLKPGNVMLTRSGVKLLDFGLARVLGHGEQGVVEGPTSAPTEPAPLTARGAILGTVPYMAPEQLEGREADARTDVWALGTILYEMVAGRRAFHGESAASLIGAILEREPPSLATLRPVTPPALDWLVRRCLTKVPDERWDSAHDAAEELRWIAAAEPAEAGTRIVGVARGWRGVVLGALALLLAACLGALAGRLLPRSEPALAVRSLLTVAPAEELNAGAFTKVLFATGGTRTALAWTPDSRSLVFLGRAGDVRHLYVRALEEEEARPIEGTEDARCFAVSPDGREIAFWAGGALRRTSIGGGPVSVWVGDVEWPPSGLDWGDDGRLAYEASDGRIWSALPGQVPAPLSVSVEGELSHSLPHLLPGGHVLLYTVRRRMWTWTDEEVVAQTLATGERKLLLTGAADARYVASGHLVFLRRGVLYGVAFDPSRLEIRGSPVPVLDDVSQALSATMADDITGAGQFSLARNGTLAYVRGPVIPFPQGKLVAVDRKGHVTPLAAPLRSYTPGLALSPDGGLLAVSVRTLTEDTIWLHALERGTLTRLLTAPGEASWPRWTPDGRHLAFSWLNGGIRRIGWQRADGTAVAEVLVAQRGLPSGWSPDGHDLVFLMEGDIWIAGRDGRRPAAPLWQSPETEEWPEISPDGRWLAFGSDTTGRKEVYVQPYPGPGPRQVVSLNGGTSPAWSPTGQELFFLSARDPEGQRSMMTVDVRPGETLALGRPRRLFELSHASARLAMNCLPSRCYAVAPDGQRFYAVQRESSPTPPPVTHIHLVQGWTAELEARVPSGRRN